MTQLERIIYGLGLLTLGLSTLYSLSWLVAELIVRLDLGRPILFGTDVAAFINSLSFVDGLPFYVHTLAKTVAFVLFAMRRKHAIGFMIVAALVGAVDWVLLAVNPYYDGGADGLWSSILQFVVLGIMLFLNARGRLR